MLHYAVRGLKPQLVHDIKARRHAPYLSMYVCAGPKGEGGLDDASGGSGGSGGGASLKQTSATVDLGMSYRAVQKLRHVVSVRASRA